jgi:hypothetical protein
MRSRTIQAAVATAAIWLVLAGQANAASAGQPLALGPDAVPFQKGFSFQLQANAPTTAPLPVPEGRYFAIEFASALCRGPAIGGVLEITTVIGKSAEQHFVVLTPIAEVGSAGSAALAAYAEPGSNVSVRIHSKQEKASGITNPTGLPTCKVTLSGVLRSARLGNRPSVLDPSASETGPGGTIRRTFECLQKDANGNCTANRCTRKQGVGQFDGCAEFSQSCKNAGLTWTPHSEGSDAGGTCSTKSPQ